MTGIDKFFSLQHYGMFPSDFSPEDMGRFGLALLKIVAADGLSDEEKWAYTELARHIGAPKAAVDQFFQTDLSTVKIEDLLRGFSDGVPARAMLYDAITIASVDGYSEEERKAAANAAKILGISPAVLATIEGVVETEMAFRRTKGALLGEVSKR